MKGYRAFTFLLILAMILGTLPGTNITAAVAEEGATIPSEEYERAVWYGFLPEELKDVDPSQTIVTWKQYCQMILSMLERKDANMARKWSELAASGLSSDVEMKRVEGCFTLYRALDEVMGESMMDLDGCHIEKNPFDLDLEFDDAHYSILTGDENDDWIFEDQEGYFDSRSYDETAVLMCHYRVSLSSFKPFYEADISPDEPLTVKDAMLSVIRLFESNQDVAQSLMAEADGETRSSNRSVYPEGWDVVVVREFERAGTYGLVPEEWTNALDEPVTNAEFCALVERLMHAANKPESIDAWRNYSKDARMSDTPLTRGYAGLALIYAAMALDICYQNILEYPELHLMENNDRFWDFGDPIAEWPDLPQDFEMLNRIPGSPTGTEHIAGTSGDGTISNVRWFLLQRLSLVNDMPLLDWDENYDQRLYDNMTRREAIIAVLRLGESEEFLLTNNHYVSINDVGGYDKSIITDELLAAPSDLPLPSQEALPSSWKGIGLSHEMQFVIAYYQSPTEAEIALLAENGFNFTRVFFDIGTLRLPDMPDDLDLVNEAMLRKLDQLIAWGIRYGVHIQLNGASTTPDGLCSVELDDGQWDYFKAYWTALARRYAGISSRYLSFELFGELEPARNDESVAEALKHLNNAVQSIKEADPERLLMVSGHANSYSGWMDGVASLGLAISCHPYYPAIISSREHEENRDVVSDVPWPYPWFPMFIDRDGALTLSGDIGGKTLELYFWGAPNPFTIDFDNGESFTDEIKNGYGGNAAEGSGLTGPFLVDIPESVGSLSVRCAVDNSLAFSSVGIVSGENVSRLFPHDFMTGTAKGNAELSWSQDDVWSGKRYLTADEIYENHIKPYRDVADKHGVGFMINEFGMYAVHQGIDASVKAAYDRDLIDMLEAKGISWCICELEYEVESIRYLPLNGIELWDNMTLEDFTHISDEGHVHTYHLCKEVFDNYRTFTLAPKDTASDGLSNADAINDDSGKTSGEDIMKKDEGSGQVHEDKATVQAVQQKLNDAGYNSGVPDGIAGKKTRKAISDYQTDKGLSITGTVTDELLGSLGIN